MATESPIRMLECDESKKWRTTMDSALFSSPFSNVAGQEGVSKVLKDSIVLEEQTRAVPNRSGSAPPTTEGSIAAFRSFMDQRHSSITSFNNEFMDGHESEEQMRINPAYIAYYYANVNLNPRLPPPLISRENRHLVRLTGGFSGKKNSATEGLLCTHKEEPEEAVSPCTTSGDQKESFVHGTMTSLVGNDGSKGDFIQVSSSTSTAAAKGENDHDIGTVSTDQSKMQESCSVSIGTNPSVSTASYYRNIDLEDNASNQSNVGSDISIEARMKTLDVSGELIREADQKRRDNLHLHNENRLLSHPPQDVTYQPPGFQSYAIPRGAYAVHQKLLPVHHPFMPNAGPLPLLYASTAAQMNSRNPFYPSVPQPGFPTPQLSLGGFSPNSIYHPHFGGYLQDNAFPVPIDAYSKAGFFRQPMEILPGEMNLYTSQLLRPSLGGPFQGQCFQPLYEDARRRAIQHQLDVLLSQKDSGAFPMTGDKELNHPAMEKPSISSPTSGTHIRVPYYGYPPSFGETQFPIPSHAVPGSFVSRNIHQGLGNDLSASENSPKSSVASSGWKGQRGPENTDTHTSKRLSFLELLKSYSSRMLELSDISGQIVEFSTDQHGSRFIQQKLENCGSDEKESVFIEVLPQASKLMTDVFGNYVVQKFFEHGTAEQRRKLAQQLTGQVLNLSLQMYGCRVIQKALEVIELDQKLELVKELEGHVLRCVHDQNGNHVIQKCIECIPTDKIKFIISSFTGHIATLSCHPYGCRVIQRVLEHCLDEQISQWVVDEILESTSTLAQDPYGNYVTQHIMEMGNPHQRSQIIHTLTGQFVQLSQHKFASNVVEKCIKYGNASERDLIIEEIIAQSSNTDALLMMMKDQYANYVVQKIFEIGSETQKDMLRNSVQLHLPDLKKVSYAKHIVSRYEQLTGESEQERKQCAQTANSVPSTSG